MQTSGLDWIDDLPPELAGQQALLRGLLALCDADERIRWLVIDCSLARRAGDRLSDLDMAMGIRDEDFDAARPPPRRGRPRARGASGELEGTVADLDPGRLLDAGRRVAVLLNEVGRRLPDDQRGALPEAMARYITADLEHVRDEI